MIIHKLIEILSNKGEKLFGTIFIYLVKLVFRYFPFTRMPKRHLLEQEHQVAEAAPVLVQTKLLSAFVIQEEDCTPQFHVVKDVRVL